MTVAPVVVKPERDSNTASVIDNSNAGENKKGKQPAVPNTAQKRVTTRKPSRVPKSFLVLAVDKNRMAPKPRIIS